MIPDAPVRRPRFLAGVPSAPTAVPARFSTCAATAEDLASLAARELRALDARDGADAARLHPMAAVAAPAPPPPDLGELRRAAMERVAGAVETLRAQADRLAEQARADAIEIGFQVARRILDAELRQGPEAFFALVRSALRRAGESRRIAVRVAPEDAELLGSDAARGALEGVTAARIECIPDPSLQRGDCVVDADFGQVDGRLGTRLAELRRATEAAAEDAA